jgi:hypothetical protein
VKKKYLTILITLFFVFAACSPLLAAKKKKIKEPEPEGLLPIKDTYVNSAYPDTNYGSDPRLITSYTTSSKIIFLQFDLDPVAFINPEQKAILNLNLESSSTSLEPLEMEVLLPYKSWEEGELSWNNKPSLYSSGLSATFEATPGAQKVDITPLVKQWINKETENYGIALYYNGENFSRKFSSKEAEKNKPQLVLTGLTESVLKNIQAKVQEATVSSIPENMVQSGTSEKIAQSKEVLASSFSRCNFDFIYDKNVWTIGLWILGLTFLIGGWSLQKKSKN